MWVWRIIDQYHAQMHRCERMSESVSCTHSVSSKEMHALATRSLIDQLGKVPNVGVRVDVARAVNAVIHVELAFPRRVGVELGELPVVTTLQRKAPSNSNRIESNRIESV